MNPGFYAPLLAATLLVGTLALLEIGRRVGHRHVARYGEKTHTGLGAVEGAVFGLLGLLLAFTFSGAMSRFDQRRHLIVDEANAIGTAWLRLDLLPPTAQPELRDLFRRYLDAHLEMYRKLPDIAAAKAERSECIKLENDIWKRAVSAANQLDKPQPAMLAISALNQMIDLANTETVATQLHPPPIIFFMLVLLALAGSFFAGYALAGSKSHHWIHIISFTVVISLTVYVILDVEYPLVGMIRVDSVNQNLVELRRSMSAQP